jgi:hypothetical protein
MTETMPDGPSGQEKPKFNPGDLIRHIIPSDYVGVVLSLEAAPSAGCARTYYCRIAKKQGTGPRPELGKFLDEFETVYLSEHEIVPFSFEEKPEDAGLNWKAEQGRIAEEEKYRQSIRDQIRPINWTVSRVHVPSSYPSLPPDSGSRYEKFSNRARKVLQLANQEAQRFNHEYVGTEHILLGVVKEGSGVAAVVLKNMNIDLREVRRRVEQLVQSGTDMVTMGKLPKTPRAMKCIEFAIEESCKLKHGYVGSEHLLLGLLREQEGVAYQVLTSFWGVSADSARLEVLRVLER